MRFCPCYLLSAASSLPLDVGYLFLVGSNILLLMVVQHQVVILDFSQEIFGQIPITLNGVFQEIFWCQERLKVGGESNHIAKSN